MLKFSVDYNDLENKIYKKSFLFKDVKNKLEKVAFDIVRFKDNDKASELWQVQKADDGEYIVALYQPDDEQQIKVSDWEVSVNKTAMNFYYKGDPIVSLNASKLGIKDTELSFVSKFLPQKLAENKTLVRTLLNEIDKVNKNIIFNKYPELI